MYEGSRTAQSAAGPEIDRLRRSEEELLGQVRRQKNERAQVEAQIQIFRNRTDLECSRNPGHQKDTN